MTVIRKKLDNFFKSLFWGLTRRIDIFGVYWVFRYCRCCISENMINSLASDYSSFVCSLILYNTCMYIFIYIVFYWPSFDPILIVMPGDEKYIYSFFFLFAHMLHNYNALLTGSLLNWFKCLWPECFLCVTTKYGAGKYYVLQSQTAI